MTDTRAIAAREHEPNRRRQRVAATAEERAVHRRRRYTVRAANLALIHCISDAYQPLAAEALAAVMGKESQALRPGLSSTDGSDTLSMFEGQETVA